MSEEVKRDPAERERIIASWTKLVEGEMKRAVPVSDRVRRGSRHLRGAIRARPRRQFGEIEGISFTFPRHRVLAEMGVFGGLTKGRRSPKGNWIRDHGSIRHWTATSLSFRMILGSCTSRHLNNSSPSLQGFQVRTKALFRYERFSKECQSPNMAQ